jgi:glucose-6-phosphate 1-epimerase
MVAGWSVGDIDGMKAVRMYVSDASSATESTVVVYLFGAHVTHWEERGQPPFIFLSKKAVMDGSKAIRGGIPICFPQFSNFGALPAHGFARTSAWTIEEKSSSKPSVDGDGIAVSFSLASSASTKAIWGHHFIATYTVTLKGASGSLLSCSLAIKNTNAEETLSFTAALHTYFSIGDISKTTVEGLQGLTYSDQLKKETLEEKDAAKPFNQEVDSIYYGIGARPLVVVDIAFKRSCTVRSTNFNDAVVWNPWIEKSKKMADFGDEEYKAMVCVEVGVIEKPVEVAAGKTWTGSVQMTYANVRSQM